jgi:hypothetical protein
MEYFYIFKNIDFDLILETFLQFTFFYLLTFYCKLLYYQQLVQFEEFEKKSIKNKFIFFICAFLYTSISLLMVPFFVLLFNSFEEPNFTAAKYAFTSSFIIIIYCFFKSFLYTYMEDPDVLSIKNEMVKELKQKLNKKPNR